MKEKSDKTDKVVITVRVSQETKEKLLDISKLEDRTITYICNKAIESYIEQYFK